MQPNKTSGPDGLTVEFHKHFFDRLSSLFLKMTHKAYLKQQLPESLSLSYITVIPKDKPERPDLNNYRPISLINDDYKIISKTISNMLRPHVAKLVHENQQCSIAGRKILNQYLHFRKDIITNTQEKQTHAAIISLDHKKYI